MHLPWEMSAALAALIHPVAASGQHSRAHLDWAIAQAAIDDNLVNGVGRNIAPGREPLDPSAQQLLRPLWTTPRVGSGARRLRARHRTPPPGRLHDGARLARRAVDRHPLARKSLILLSSPASSASDEDERSVDVGRAWDGGTPPSMNKQPRASLLGVDVAGANGGMRPRRILGEQGRPQSGCEGVPTAAPRAEQEPRCQPSGPQPTQGLAAMAAERPSPGDDPAEAVARVSAAKRDVLLRVHRHRLGFEDLEDCFSQATLELSLARVLERGRSSARRTSPTRWSSAPCRASTIAAAR